MKFKLITYNVWQGRHLDKVIQFLQSEKADIVCLQEVGMRGQGQGAAEVNLFEEIKQGLGIDGIYRRYFWADEGQGKYDMGIAIYTGLPVREIKEFRYERRATEEILEAGGKDRYNIPRVLIGQKIGIGGGKLWVFTTHHTITPHAGVTEHQLQATKQVKGFLADYDEYILCGDMNTPYGNENYELLSQGLADVSKPTEPTLHPTIHKVGYKRYHVDYVFIKGKGIKQVSTRIPVMDASDHLPVVVELEV
ncbi:hypothetical protein A2W24_05500 [Microgenomates group bacterium RBG_16_45_19]|nr:MAG: hypothetical protein A2W24_05500 [Microgenomates group bacterium RBG_16_45_19]